MKDSRNFIKYHGEKVIVQTLFISIKIKLYLNNIILIINIIKPLKIIL
jgi:hypothetical protein